MKIGFIAMSGIRACDPELLELGLTLPGFVERSKQIASLPSLGLLTLAGITPKHHDIKYIEIPDLYAEEDELELFDLVAISSLSAQINEAYELAKRYRDRGTRVVMGGLHVTAMSHEARRYCTSVVIGEGEPVWHQILEDAENGTMKLIYDGRKLGYRLHQSEMPAFELLDIEKYNRITIQTSRGCPHDCEFCAGSNLISSSYKQKPVEKVLAELDKVCEIWPHPFIEFADDNSFINRRWWKEFLPKLAKRKIKWFTETDLAVSEDPELLEMMRESGCAQVLIGLESPTSDPLNGLELKANFKQERFAQYKDAIRIIQSHGITVNGCFIIGLDGQTKRVFDDVYDFVKETELYEVQITILTPFPGTPLYERLKRDNRLIEPTNWKKCTLFDLNFRPLGMTEEELSVGFRELSVRLYSEEFTNWRRDRFKENLRKALRDQRNERLCA